MTKYKVVIADDDRNFTASIKLILEQDNYDVIVFYDGITASEKIQEIKPDLVLLDYDMPGMNGYDVCRKLRENITTRYIPIIIVTGKKTTVYDKIIGLKTGADDYMVKPFDTDELKARILRLIQRTKEIISLNPLTKLPGNIRIEEEITKRIASGNKFAVGYVDLDHFKAYNDTYGYKKGDNVINLLNQIVFEGISLHGNPDDFIGHIGGDDFIIVSSVDKIDEICRYITNNFDQRIPAYYHPEDRTRGYITTIDRKGNKKMFPIMTVSIGIATNEKREINHYAEIIDILIEMKKYAKSLEEREGSTFVKDRRSSQSKIF